MVATEHHPRPVPHTPPEQEGGPYDAAEWEDILDAWLSQVDSLADAGS